MSSGLILVLIILIVIFALIISFISISNKINRCSIKIDEAKSSIEIALVKRYDVLKQSAECVKKYAEHESTIFNQLTEVRRGMSISQLQNASEQQASIMGRLLAVGEAYPTLKADNVYSGLQRQISEENEHLAAAKRMYNGNISTYNQLIVSFPSYLVASCKGCTKLDFFKDDNVESKKEVELNL